MKSRRRLPVFRRAPSLTGEALLTLASAPALLMVAWVLEELHALLAMMPPRGSELPALSQRVASSFGVHQGDQVEVMAAVWGGLVVWWVVCRSTKVVASPPRAFLHGWLGVWLLVFTYSQTLVLAALLPWSPFLASIGSHSAPSLAARVAIACEVVLVLVVVARAGRRGSAHDRARHEPGPEPYE